MALERVVDKKSCDTYALREHCQDSWHNSQATKHCRHYDINATNVSAPQEHQGIEVESGHERANRGIPAIFARNP